MKPTSRSGALMLEALKAPAPKTKPVKRKPGMTFEIALGKLRDGKAIRRRAWHSESLIFRLDGEVFVRLPRGCASAPAKWQPYSHDFLAADWEVVQFVNPR